MVLLAVIYVAGSIYFFYTLRGRIDELSKGQGASNAQIAELSKRMQSAESDAEALATQLGMTKKELAERSAELTRQQHAAEQRLSEEQK
jgi:outer membrane murein-binding lipoprotein Lpp